MFTVRGRIIGTLKPAWTENEAFETTGRNAVVIAYVKTGAKRIEQQFRFLCKKHSLTLGKRLDEDGEETDVLQHFPEEGLTAFEIIALDGESLNSVLYAEMRINGKLTRLVKKWHFCLDTRVPFRSIGSGEEKHIPDRRESWVKAEHKKAELRFNGTLYAAQ